MKPRKTDEAYLWDMREAAIEAGIALGGLSKEGFLEDPVRIRAIERLIEIIGEAASHVSRGTRQRMTGIPWEKIIGQRHVLAHDYGEIDFRRLYEVVEVHLPQLVANLDKIGLEPSVLRPKGD